MSAIHHALALNLHQPPGNLEEMLARDEWQAREILCAIDRIPRSLWGYEDVARVHLSLSGTLLETLARPDFQRRAYGLVDCGSLLWYLQNTRILRILGTAFYHAVLPLTPPADWHEQIARWRGVARHLFWRTEFPGFWPPELGFRMELIPLLASLGYEYVIVDSAFVEPVDTMRWEELRYQPHVACYAGARIVVVVRDRELSDAQESGMDYSWFEREVRARTRWCYWPPLVTTCTDGDNGGWFRNTTPSANFWGAFYRELLDNARRGADIRPVFIEDYIARYGVRGEVRVTEGAWNTGWHHGRDFVQWTGSRAQQDALARVAETSRAVHELRRRASEMNGAHADAGREVEGATWHLLRAETSCNFFWGTDWVDRCHRDLDEAWQHIARSRELLPN